MELKAEIQESVKIAMKSGDSVTLSTLRLLLAAIQNEEIRTRKNLTPEEIQKTITTLCKQRNEAIELYRKGGREELAQKEESELAVLKRYLPQPLADEELKNFDSSLYQRGRRQRRAGSRQGNETCHAEGCRPERWQASQRVCQDSS